MPRLRAILATCTLILMLSVAATALLSNVQRLHGEVTLDRGKGPERAVVSIRPPPLPAPRTYARRAARPVPGIGARIAGPRPAYAPAPRYPIEALREQRQGLVMVRVWLDPGGRVIDAAVQQTSGDAGLDQAAVHALRRWIFDMPPYARRETVVPIRFHIDGSRPQ